MRLEMSPAFDAVAQISTRTSVMQLRSTLARLGVDLLKVIWWDGQGACLFSKRLERGRFVWPSIVDGKLTISPAQLAMLLEGIDWRAPLRTWRPLTAG